MKAHSDSVGDSSHVDKLHSVEGTRFQQIRQCDANNCLLLYRHQNTKEEEDEKGKGKDEEADQTALFYRDLMDALHCYLVHQFEIGIRIKVRQRRDGNDDWWMRWGSKDEEGMYKFVCRIHC